MFLATDGRTDTEWRCGNHLHNQMLRNLLNPLAAPCEDSRLLSGHECERIWLQVWHNLLTFLHAFSSVPQTHIFRGFVHLADRDTTL